MTPSGSDNAGQGHHWSADELIPFGKYILLDRISSGATAAVYRGKIRGEAGFERVVAIKRILPHMAGDPSFVNTFVREAKIAALLNHTNICPIYELGKVGESLYMAMEYVAGIDLGKIRRRVNKRGESIPPIVAAWICAKLCDALDYAHNLKDARGRGSGLVHRDLSPTNILMSFEGQVKLIDFGLAKASGRAQQTNVDALKKKLGYMSPEMVKGKTIDGRSDIFGLGVILYEMLTSRRLFAGADDMATLKLVSAATVPPPSALMDDPPEELEMIIMRALERDPDDRWQSAHEMGESLMGFIGATDPMYGARQLSEWVTEYFGENQRAEQERINVLLEASNNPAIIEERKRFFLSPDGASAMARAEIARKMSTEPPPILGGPMVASMPANPVPKIASANTTVRGLQPVNVSVSDKPADGPNEFDEDESTNFFDPARNRLGVPGQDAPDTDDEVTPASLPQEKTEFLNDEELAAGVAAAESTVDHSAEQTEFLQADQLDAMTVDEPGAQPPPRKDGFGFDEDATEIFFNKEDGVGVEELLNQGEAIAASPSTVPPPNRAHPLPAANIPVSMPSPAGARPPAATDPSQALVPPSNTEIHRSQRRTTARMTVQLERPQPQSSGWLLILGLILLALAVAGVIAKTPVGVRLGLRSPSVGSIEIRTTPAVGAAVKLDEVFRGRAPIRMDGVRTGKRKIEIYADGFLPAIREVHMTGGKTALVDVTLVPTSRAAPAAAQPRAPPKAPPGPETPTPEPSPPSGAKTRSTDGQRDKGPGASGEVALAAEAVAALAEAQPGATPTADMGTLSINSKPWARVFIDDESMGNTPMLDQPVPAGSHKVSLQTPDGIKHSEWVRIKAGGKTELVRDFSEPSADGK